MGLDYAEPEEIIIKKPECDKCHKELKSNNQFSCDDSKTICGDCRKKYLEYIRKFFES